MPNDAQPTAAIKFSNPEFERLGNHLKSSAARGLPMAKRDMHAGERGAIICGLGPSIQKPSVLREIRDKAKKGWYIFGLKEAATFLKDKGIKVHYGCNMDPGPQECGRTPIYEDVTYCLASSCHPELYDHVLSNGGKVLIFHSACGYTEKMMKPGFFIDFGNGDQAITLGQYEMKTISDRDFSPVFSAEKNEVEIYKELFGTGDVVIGGFTVANRAMGLASYMGFKKIILAGVDFGWRIKDNDMGSDGYYAGFVNAEPLQDVFMTDSGRVDGKPWKTRPDLLASAVDVARHIKRGTVRVIGDSLAVSLSKKDDDYLDNVVRINND
jgi:hypothetical protein